MDRVVPTTPLGEFLDSIKTIEIQKLGEDATVPSQPRDGDAGIDLYAAETKILKPITSLQKKIYHVQDPDRVIAEYEEWGPEQKHAVLVSTQIAMAIPKGYFGKIEDRSSMALKGLRTGAGVIDSSYRGEIKVVIFNLGRFPYTITKGDRIAQLVIHAVPNLPIQEVHALPETDRGTGGFGSTGV